MANVLYPKFKQNLMEGDIDFDTGTVNAYLVDQTDYTYAATHELIADLPGAAQVATVALAGQTVTDGTLDVTTPFTFVAVTGDECDAVVISIDSGGSEYLVAYYDTVSGLPITPTGGNIEVAVNASGLFDL